MLCYIEFHSILSDFCFNNSQCTNQNISHDSVTLCFVQGKRVLEEEIKEIKSVSDSLEKELATCKTQNRH